MSDGPPKIERVGRQVIEKKLLTALDDSATVAVLMTKDDLRSVIEGLQTLADHKTMDMAHDYQCLYDAAFGK